ncbi:MAG: UDP-N-acetylglucosamine--N-acetylmuramyl-(pentapeptide) pyrophosphoryl-undecaprenol N-acetylglucosamine transferase [Candidatus Curtissbacteria bacterium]|nr:UDP-N-acetylglucosamine--N-acetylmuramyl-(pentapeptide) pyrophosphoryl-undecaprenol N-acetylglucosamine transferase [Candidatus Curtissbacteria bacterium]
MKKLVLCGGHLSPALAVIEALGKKADIKIFFFGRRHATEGHNNLSAEYNEITATNATFVNIITGRLQRKFSTHTIWSLLKIPIGFVESFYYLLKIRPDMVVSFGSYQSIPTVVCAWLLGIKSIAHEQAIIPGLATKINARFTQKIFLTWAESAKYFNGSKIEVVGNLTRGAVFSKTPRDEKIKIFLSADAKKIFVTGGNQGSHFINKIIFDILPKLSEFKIIHQVGTTNYGGDLDHAKKIEQTNYLPIGFIASENIGAIFNKADLVIGRSGANTVWELATLAKISILIPLPHAAAGEQLQNAQLLEHAGSAVVILQKNATGDKLRNSIDEIYKNQKKYQKNANDFSKKLPRDGVEKIKKYIIDDFYVRKDN